MIRQHSNMRRSALIFGLAAGLAASGAQADQVILDDLIVDGSACIGFDCVNGESFGFDTIRIKENNLRIKAQDTSSSASFPTRDWQITFNDSANGGANKFSIDDIDGGLTPFTIEAGAPSHSLYVDDSGRIGNGTSTPVVDLHIKSGNTPTMRLEQDGSSGFSPQIWDVAGNEAGFFVRDATNGSTLPFRIMPGASSRSLVIDDDDDIGMSAGTNPTAALHVKRSDGTVQMLIEEASTTKSNRTMLVLSNKGRPRIQMTNTDASGGDWTISAGNTFVVKDLTDNQNVLIVDQDGNMTIAGGLISTGGGGLCTVGDPCDLVFDPEVYQVPSIQEHAQLMWQNKYLPAVGPTNPDAPLNVTAKLLRMLNELEHAHIYIADLEARLSSLEQRVSAD